jgi:hypothetical protein
MRISLNHEVKNRRVANREHKMRRKMYFRVMSLRKELEKQQKAGVREGAWLGLVFGIVFLLIALYCHYNQSLHDYTLKDYPGRYGGRHTTTTSPKEFAVMMYVASFCSFLFSFFSFRRMKKEKAKH